MFSNQKLWPFKSPRDFSSSAYFSAANDEHTPPLSLTKCRGSWVVGNSRGSWVWVWVKVVGNKI